MSSAVIPFAPRRVGDKPDISSTVKPIFGFLINCPISLDNTSPFSPKSISPGKIPFSVEKNLDRAGTFLKRKLASLWVFLDKRYARRVLNPGVEANLSIIAPDTPASKDGTVAPPVATAVIKALPIPTVVGENPIRFCRSTILSLYFERQNLIGFS